MRIRELDTNSAFFFPLAELGHLSGVAAILRFPMPEIDSEETDDSTESDEETFTS